MPGNGCDVVVVGASAGGVEALTRLVQALPEGFPAPVLVVLHVPPTSPSVLPAILTRAGNLPASRAADGARLEPGHVYVAPPDRHLRVAGNTMRVDAGPQENGHRPAIDPLFRSAAETHDGRAAGVILSGALDDGTVGLHLIAERGGATLVQHPDDALYRSMPANAIEYTDPDFVLPVEELAAELVRLTRSWNGRRGTRAGVAGDAPNPAGQEDAQPGHLAPFACPECGGTLWERQEGSVTTYRCRVGHAFSINSLAAAHGESVERALWTAYRALEERAAVSRRIARRLTGGGRKTTARRFERQAAQTERQAAELKRVLDSVEPPVDAGAEPAKGTG